MMDQQKLEQKDRTTIKITDHWFIYQDDPWKFLCLNEDGRVTWIRFVNDRLALSIFRENHLELKVLKQLRPMFFAMASENRESFTLEEKKKVVLMLPGLEAFIPDSDLKALNAILQVQPVKNGIPADQSPSVQGTNSMFLPDVDWAVETMRRFQELKRRLLEKSDTVVKGDREYPKKSGCRKYALAFRLSLQTMRIEHESIGDEKVARVWTRATAPDGVFVDGYGVCDSETVRKSKMDASWHNVESKAQTRSYNRAILDLVGGGEVSAEEME